MSEDTGNLAIVSFPISGFTARFRQIGELDRAIGKLEIDALDVDGEKEYVPDDLAEPGEVEFEFFFDTKTLPPDPGDMETPVITFPTREDEASAASWTASGFFLNQLLPALKNGQLQSGKAKFALDGKGTKFTFTPAVAS